MPTYQVTETIAEAQTSVWPVLADVLRWPDWTPTVSKVEALDGPTLVLGSRFKVIQPKLQPAVWTVTAISPSDHFSWSARSPGVQMIAEHTLRAEDAGTTRLELRFTFTGLLGPIVGALARRVVIDYLSTEAAKLKSTVEGRAGEWRDVA